MGKKKKTAPRRLRITESDYLKANRRAARLEEIELHGKPVRLRAVLHKSRKAYDRRRGKAVPEEE
ncbi:MAG: hypothetical protein K5910_08545 [Bacteroidales bacterium]|nr:hypothetical protein [Bacteroidales bacterium]